jgi:hypothetical protein
MPAEQRPVSDPEAEGLPGTADDDSTAYDDVDSARIADGPDPAALPADHPTASLDYGTTPREAATPEPLADRLDREEPDPVAGVDENNPGRLVAPDEGAHVDQEGAAIATAAGAAGGGLSAEEAAVHEEPDDEGLG